MIDASVLRAPRTTLFGWGAIESAGPVTAELGGAALVCTDEAVIGTASGRELVASLERAGVRCEVFAGTLPELPRPNLDECLERARSAGAEVLVGFGGGSAIDMAKVTALRLAEDGDLDDYVGEGRIPSAIAPVVGIPTTAGTGSEVSPVTVISDREGRTKLGISSPRLVPRAAICDPAATLSCPPGVTAHSGVDALVHAVESYLAGPREADWSEYPGPVFRGANPLTAPLALSAAGLIAGSLERVLADGSDRAARASMLMGSLQAGISFSQAGNGAAHALQYPIGARTGTPHGLGVGLLAPYVLQYVLPRAERPLARVAGVLGVGAADSPGQAAVDEIARLVAAAEIPGTLAGLGVRREEVAGLAREAAGIDRLLRNSPRTLGPEDLERILEAAWSGNREQLKEH